MRLTPIPIYTPSPRILFTLALLLVVFVLAVVLFRGSDTGPQAHPARSSIKQEFDECVDNLWKFVPKPLQWTKTNNYIDAYFSVSENCEKQVQAVATLKELEVNQAAYSGQAQANPTILWMVVGITIAGVGLAALQLFASYLLATGGKGELGSATTFTAEAGKVTLQSSITGLVILVVSLAFFWLYVRDVYKITEHPGPSIIVEPARGVPAP